MRIFLKNIKIISICTMGLFLFISPIYSVAQTELPTLPQGTRPIGLPTVEEIRQNALNEYLTVDITPKTPGPNEVTTIKVSSNLVDISRAEIFWYLNNTQQVSGIGEKTFSFTTSGAGDVYTIDVVIKTAEGERIDKNITIRPVGLDILWEADSYTPPFYKGKALLSPRGIVRIVAFPNFVTGNGNKIGKENLVYRWDNNRRVVEEASGYGKNSFSLVGPKPFGNLDLSVEISSLGGTLKTERSIDVSVVDPFIKFYEDKPLFGIAYENALDKNFDLGGKELAIKAEPYFFSSNDRGNRSLIYIWSLNGNIIEDEDGETITERITFGNENSGVGTANVNLSVVNPIRTFQTALKSFILNFGISDTVLTEDGSGNVPVTGGEEAVF